MPGKKDFVSVKKEGKRQHIQKWLVLSNLREVYREFKERFSDRKVGFSKFDELRPKHCILVGASDTHSVCVCTIHQNVKFMMFEMQPSELPTYRHCLAKIMCNPPHPRCYLGECDYCPWVENLKQELLSKWHGSNCLPAVGFHWQIHTWDIFFSSRGICWLILWEVRAFAPPLIHCSRAGFILRNL